jgi:hypothetical protein
MAYTPDPLRDHFTRGARQLLARAYAHQGAWQGTRLASPDAAGLAECARLGIDPFGPDNTTARRRAGGLNARSRWMRAFIRCLYEQHQFWADSQVRPGWRDERRLVPLRTRGISIDVGRAVPALGVIPAGRAIRLKVYRAGAQASFTAVDRKPDRDRIYLAGRVTGPKQADGRLRDW